MRRSTRLLPRFPFIKREVRMGLFDSVKNRISSNVKLMQLSSMVRQDQITAFCQTLTTEERATILKGIEGQFKWQPVAQIAQALFPAQSQGVSAEAHDMVLAGQVEGGLELMRMQNASVQPQFGMTPYQQAALSYAWTVLKAMDQRDAMAAAVTRQQHASAMAPPAATSDPARFCTSCGARREASGRFCGQCGAPFHSTSGSSRVPGSSISTPETAKPAPQARPDLAATVGATSGQPSRAIFQEPGIASRQSSLGNEDEALFGQVASMLQQASSSGQVSPERAEALKSVIEQFHSTVGQQATTPGEFATQATQMREVLSRYKNIYTSQKVASNNRAGLASQLFSEVRGYLLDQGNRPNLGAIEQQTTMNLLLEAGHINKALLDAGDNDVLVRAIERDRMRGFLHGVRQFALRRHATLADPLWGWTKVIAVPNRIFFAGGEALQLKLGDLCAVKDLELCATQAAWGTAQSHWNSLRSSAVAIFDFTSAAQAIRSSVSHTLGGALALGIMPMIVADPEAAMPFDLDIEPVRTNADLDLALDRALYAVPQVGGASCLRETVQALLPRCKSSDATTTVTARSLASSDLRDSVETVNAIELLASLNSDGSWGVIRPAWPGAHPPAGKRRCFHIMPFSQSWSNSVRDVVRSACGDHVTYMRGDETGDPRVILSIWNEICLASFVVVDLTGMNDNVCLELGLAQALGKRSLLAHRADEQGTRRSFPEIAKVQVHRYKSDADLTTMVRSFIAN
jgi:hypothetical protein